MLIDVELLGMNGFELRERLRDVRSLVPHIFVTAHSNPTFQNGVLGPVTAFALQARGRRLAALGDRETDPPERLRG